MPSSGSIGKFLLILGIILSIFGLILILAERLNIQFFKLPGDLVLKKENFTLYFPVVTSILLSILVTVILYLINKWK